MPAGFQVFDEAGRVVFDGSTAFGRQVGSTIINSPTMGGITDPDLAPMRIWHALMSPFSILTMDITYDGNTILWSDARYVHDRPWADPISDYSAVLIYGNY